MTNPLIHKAVDEYLLVSKAGYDRRDIHGDERRGYTVRPRRDVSAEIQRVFSHLGRRRASATIGTCIGSIGVTALLAGLESVGLFAFVVAAVLTGAFYRSAPEWLFSDPDPTAEYTYSSTDGMTEPQLYRRLLIHKHREELEEEIIEYERKKQRKQQEGR